ncbi:related to G protein coupled receptor like protein [Cephalotrichum gorgonifer]|uniref:Related to G protein coupled receptor like protein n=1 Tax=Cephalotrichum gorgonifer TaxID=2041049 RepID=A0AAE8MNQ0_9PEZI|nr:related to G protein coupled receptor like protein [Cephalotrichum gorgonifer]
MIETNGHDRPGQMDLTQKQIDTLVTLERVGSSLSLVGVALIFVTYLAFKRMRTVLNLFLLFASVANAGASVACLIGFDGLRAGVDSALCQTQAFLLEMFMQSDPWWSFAMAINVFLVFFVGANPATFRKHVWIYCVVCFGLPFIPAVACLLVKGEKGRVYGDATLWCWIGPEWTSLRIYTYYLPIWVCILFSTLIYFAVGYHVFHQRNQLRNLTFSTHGKGGKETSSTDNLTGRSDVYGTAVTEVQITSCIPRPWTPPTAYTLADKRTRSTESLYNQGPYLGVDEERPATAAMEPGSHARFETICSSTSALPHTSSLRTSSSALSKFRAKLRNLDPVKLAYLRTSFVFAISILVTWTPSSINRVHNLIYANDVSYGLNVASAVVLPLQGVWNAVIYFSTSWGVCKEEMGKTWPGLRARAWRAGKKTEKADAVSRDRDRVGDVGGGVRESGEDMGGITRDEIEDMAFELSSVKVGNGTVRAMRRSF